MNGSDLEPTTDSRIWRVETIVSYILRGGVVVSFLVILLGCVLMFSRHGDYFHSRTALETLVTKDAQNVHGLAEVASAVTHGQGRGWILVGLLCLIGTPVLRVIAALIAFSFARDRAFVICSAVVLLLLLASFLLGHLHS